MLLNLLLPLARNILTIKLVYFHGDFFPFVLNYVPSNCHPGWLAAGSLKNQIENGQKNGYNRREKGQIMARGAEFKICYYTKLFLLQHCVAR